MADPTRPPTRLTPTWGDGALLILGSVLSVVCGVLGLRIVLTHLSEADYGRYSIFLVLVGLGTVATSWPSRAGLRLGADEVAERGAVGRTLGSLLALVGLSALTLLAAAALGRRALDAWIGAPGWGWAVGFAIASSVGGVGITLFRPVGLARFMTLVPALARAALVLGLVGVAWGVGRLELEWVFALGALSTTPLVLGAVWGLRGHLRGVGWDRARAGRGARFGAPLLLRDLGIAGLLYVDVLVLRGALGPVEAGRYDVAYRVAEQLLVFGFVLEHLAGPLLADAAARGREAVVPEYLRRVVPALAWGWGFATAGLAAVAEPALWVLGAKSPAASAEVLRVVLIAAAIRGVSNLERPVFDAHLLSAAPTVFFYVALALNWRLDVAAVNAGWGIVGPAWATVAAFSLQALLRSGYLARRFRASSWRAYLGVAPVCAITFVGGSPIVGLGVWGGCAAGFVVTGRGLGWFRAADGAALLRTRFPGPLRRAVRWAYRIEGDACDCE